MTDQIEQSYIQGSRAAWTEMLQQCLRQLGYDDPAAQKTDLNWILEREAAINKLREVCEWFGDNDWGSDLHLADIIEKHLARYLSDNQSPTDQLKTFLIDYFTSPDHRYKSTSALFEDLNIIIHDMVTAGQLEKNHWATDQYRTLLADEISDNRLRPSGEKLQNDR